MHIYTFVQLFSTAYLLSRFGSLDLGTQRSIQSALKIEIGNEVEEAETWEVWKILMKFRKLNE